jgi:hypothetical protein
MLESVLSLVIRFWNVDIIALTSVVNVEKQKNTAYVNRNVAEF